MSFIAFPMGIPSIEAEEVAASSLSEKMTSVLIASLPGRLPLHIIDHTHDSKVTYSVKRAEWETSWE